MEPPRRLRRRLPLCEGENALLILLTYSPPCKGGDAAEGGEGVPILLRKVQRRLRAVRAAICARVGVRQRIRCPIPAVIVMSKNVNRRIDRGFHIRSALLPDRDCAAPVQLGFIADRSCRDLARTDERFESAI